MSISRPGLHIQLNIVASIALLVGLLIFAVSGLVSWLIALCGGFDVARASYRLARNLEHAMVHDPVAAIPIRLSGKLQIRRHATL